VPSEREGRRSEGSRRHEQFLFRGETARRGSERIQTDGRKWARETDIEIARKREREIK
jgi:hypothetical protein